MKMRSAETHVAISSAFDALSAPYPTGTRPGYYVEGRYYRDQFHQARARAAWLAQQYGRGIDLWRVDPGAGRVLVLTVFNGKGEAA